MSENVAKKKKIISVTAGKIHPDLDKLSNILPLGLRPRGSKNSRLSLSGKFIFPAVTVIAIPIRQLSTTTASRAKCQCDSPKMCECWWLL